MNSLIKKIENAKLLGIEYKDISSRAGITTQYLYNIRKTKSDPTTKKADAIKRAIRELKIIHKTNRIKF